MEETTSITPQDEKEVYNQVFDIKAKLCQPDFTPEIYQKLLKAVNELPKEAVETATSEKTRKGYDTTGYQYQFLINVLNDIVGVSNWGFSYKIIKEKEGSWSNGKSFYELCVECSITILGVTRSCVGGHKSEMYADTLKGAITNGLKKTLAFFGIGKKAYEGTLDDDYLPIPFEPIINKTVKTLQKQVNDIQKVYHCENCNTEVKYITAKAFLAKKLPIMCKDCFQNNQKDKESFEKVAEKVENEFNK